MSQLDLFAVAETVPQVAAVAPMMMATGAWGMSEADGFRAALVRGDLGSAVNTLARLKLADAERVLLTAGFSVGRWGSRAAMLGDVQGPLVEAARRGVDGFGLREVAAEVKVAANHGLAIAERKVNMVDMANKPRSIQDANEKIISQKIGSEFNAIAKEESAAQARTAAVGKWRSTFVGNFAETTASGDIASSDYEKLGQLVDDGKLSLDRASEMIDSAVSAGVLDALVADRMRKKIAMPVPVVETLPGTRSVAQRMVNASSRFVDSVVEQFGLSEADAGKAWNYFVDHKLVKVDVIGGQYSLKDGRLWDGGVMRRAAMLGDVQEPLVEAATVKVVASIEQRGVEPEQTAEQKIRRAFDALPDKTLGKTQPISVEHNGVVRQFLAYANNVPSATNQMRGLKSPIHLAVVKAGRMLRGDPVSAIVNTFTLDGRDVLTETGMPRLASVEDLKQWTDAGLIDPLSAQKTVPMGGKSRAIVGGQSGVNGYAYKGGQFLPSTMAEPGKWKVGKKWITSRNEEIEPGVIAAQPTPFSRSIFQMIHGLCQSEENGQIALRDGIKDYQGEAITLDTLIRPGVKGVLGKEELSLGELVDAYNAGQRWFDVQPDALTITNQLEKDHVQRISKRVESDRADAGDGDAVGAGVVSVVAGGVDVDVVASGKVVGGAEVGRAGDSGLSNAGSVAGGESGDFPVFGDDGGFGSAGSVARGDERAGGVDSGAAGIPVGAGGVGGAGGVVGGFAAGLAAKRQAQAAADSVGVVFADVANVHASLPFLEEGQREDVAFAERRWAKPDGYGVLFANGTGTGKTFVGLGAAKRMVQQGMTEGIIVVPSDAVVNAWVRSGRDLGLTITPLRDTRDAGAGVSITTFANFGQNAALAGRDFNFVFVDEAHLLMSNSKAADTKALDTLRAITHHPRGVSRRVEMLHGELMEEVESLGKEKAGLLREMAKAAKPVSSDALWDLRKKLEGVEPGLVAAEKQLAVAKAAVREDVEGRQGSGRARVMLLSATPFAYEKNIQWAEGYLLNYPAAERGGYNSGGGYEQFMMQHFGYRMRYNKLTEPDAAVDRDLMQRQFNSWLRKEGALSARVLDVDQDYERRFILIDGGVGAKIDSGLEWLRNAENGRYQALYTAVSERFDYFTRMRLLEAIKAKEAVSLIAGQHEIGKKVIVFHDFNEGGGTNVFDLADMLGEDLLMEVPMRGQAPGVGYTAAVFEKVPVGDLVREFRDDRADLWGLDFSDLKSPLETLTKAFPGAGVYNGLSSYKRTRQAAIDAFNDDSRPDANLLIVQKAANAGWSGHDTTGKFPRVLLNLGLPTAPVEAIQQEGRAYRVGQASDACFQYLNTGTSWERYTFGGRIAQRAGTAENLAMGEQARALRDAFVEAFENSDGDYVPSLDDGKGGKAKDRALVKALSEFERAKSFYFGKGKRTAKNKSAEGSDFFATAEPLGLKMVEWADGRAGDKFCEPSAGDGAIARWFPVHHERTVVEPSFELASRLSLVTDAKIVNHSFEDLHAVNKFDVIVMNPPFGTASKTAVEHIEKAMHHLNDGGRVVALLPEGPAAEKRLEDLLYGTRKVPARALLETPVGEVFHGDIVGVKQANGDVMEFAVDKKAPNGWLVLRDRMMAPVDPARVVSVRATGKRSVEERPGKEFHLSATISLPTCAFERAGTAVKTQIVVLDKVTDETLAAGMGHERIDLSSAATVQELFDRIEFLGIVRRREGVGQEAGVQERAVVKAVGQKMAGGERSEVASAVVAVAGLEAATFTHTKTGEALFGVRMGDRLEREAYTALAASVQEYGGSWSRFAKQFLFKSEGDRDRFMAASREGAGREVTGGDLMGKETAGRDSVEGVAPVLRVAGGRGRG